MEGSPCKVIGYYVTEKKNAKMNWAEFENICRNRGFSLVKVNLQKDLEKQGPFFAIIHKMTEVIFKSSLGDIEADAALKNFETFRRSHPEVIFVDPLDKICSLLDRSRYYRIVQNSDLAQDKVFTPTFVDLASTDLKENLQRLKDAGVTYPFVCKPSLSHGSSDAHQMALVFNDKGVADCKPPCVAQSFINHNAVLYKIYVVGDTFNVSERPSLKNFSASDQKTIFFTTSDVSKADSTSSLTVLDPEDAAAAPPSNPDAHRLQHIVSTLRRELGMILFGVDVVIEHGSGRYGIIDINIFPGYDGFPNFFDTLLDTVISTASTRNVGMIKKSRRLSDETSECASARKHEKVRHPESFSPILPPVGPRHNTSSERNADHSTNQEYDQEDSGFDTSDSSDERKKNWHIDRGRGDQTRKVVRSVSVPFYSTISPNEKYVKAGLSGS